MRRILILGRGAAGKSTLARRLGALTGLPVTELDKVFWQPGLLPLPRAGWIALQKELTRQPDWILDGDLGPYDALEVRLRAADTVILLDFGLLRCTWRAVRRSRERADFWRWLLNYRRKEYPRLRALIAQCAPQAAVHFFHSPREVEQFVSDIEHGANVRNRDWGD